MAAGIQQKKYRTYCFVFSFLMKGRARMVRRMAVGAGIGAGSTEAFSSE